MTNISMTNNSIVFTQTQQKTPIYMANNVIFTQTQQAQNQREFRQYLKEIKTLISHGEGQCLCGVNYAVARVGWRSSQGMIFKAKVYKMIKQLYAWNLGRRNRSSDLSYYWPVTTKGNKIRLAILNVWIRFGGMKNKETFLKHLETELSKVSLSIDDLYK